MARAIDIQNVIEEIKSSLEIPSYGEHDKGFDHGLEYVLDLIEKAPTLTPTNEWVEALEAINNAAVAYIEGGPYENDLPGMELAVEIDRLSRDFVRPPNERLTLEQLRQMDGQPVWDENGECYLVDTTYRFCSCSDIEIAIVAKNGEIKRYPQRYVLYRRPPEGEANA